MFTCSPSLANIFSRLFTLLVVFVAFPKNVSAEIVHFDFSTNPPLAPSQQPGAWFPDRRAPAEFDSELFLGENVLQIGIEADDLDPNAFYNTQGRKYDIVVAEGGSIEASLYIPLEWSTAPRRSDIWATGSSANFHSVTAYVIMGFTSLDNTPTLRVYDSDFGWVNLDFAIPYDSWVNFRVDFTGQAFVYSINGTHVFTDADVNGTTQFHDVMLQAYNTGVTFSAHWKDLIVDTALVPEPTTAVGLLVGLTVFLRRRSPGRR
jgi:hypothetical protein